MYSDRNSVSWEFGNRLAVISPEQPPSIAPDKIAIIKVILHAIVITGEFATIEAKSLRTT